MFPTQSFQTVEQRRCST